MKARSPMLCIFMLMILMFGLSFSAFSQFSTYPKWEAGIGCGPIACMGDLGGNYGKGAPFIKDYNFPDTRFSEGAYLGFQPLSWAGFQLSLDHGELYGNDAFIKSNEEWAVSRRERNLDFRSQLYEASLVTDIYPSVLLEDDPERTAGKFRPYVLVGFGVFHFNPQGTYTNPSGKTYWVDLRPLHTEGEGFLEYPRRKEYALTQVYIPMGSGVSYYPSPLVTVSAEIVYSKTFTDYLDDVSTTYIDPALFYKYLSPSLAPVADYMSNKSPLRNKDGSGFQPGDKRGDSGEDDCYFRFRVKVSFRLGQLYESWLDPAKNRALRF